MRSDKKCEHQGQKEKSPTLFVKRKEFGKKRTIKNFEIFKNAFS